MLGEAASAHILSKEWVMRWNETGSMARERQNPKRPLLPEELVTTNPLLPQRSILCQPTALLCSDPAKRREGERFREDSKEESSPVPGARPSDRNAKSKTRPSGNFCNKLVYRASPLPMPAVGLHSLASKCNLLNCHCMPASETGRHCLHKNMSFWTLKSRTKGLTLASERSFTFKFAIVVAASCHLQWKSTRTPPAVVWSRNQPPAFMC